MSRPILVRNGLLVGGVQSGSYLADVLIAEGKIAAVATLPEGTFPASLQERVAAAEVLDATGCIVMPGGIDPHVHFELTSGGLHVADNFRVASLAALYGGNTCVVEHPSFGLPGCDLLEPVQDYAAIESFVDYGIHLVFQPPDGEISQGLTAWPQLEKIPAAVALGYASGKAYTTYIGKLDDARLLQVMDAVGQADCLLAVHCENDAIIARQRRLFDPYIPGSYPLSRPPEAEAEAVNRVLTLAGIIGVPVYIVHVSAAKTLQVILEARTRGQIVYAETCPQYLLLDSGLYAGPDGLDYVMAPPLRKPADSQALWQALAAGEIDVVATDHCCYSRAQKQIGRGAIFQSPVGIPGGIPGVETRLPLLYEYGVLGGRISLERFVQVCATNPASIFGLRQKGLIAQGREADILVIDPERESGLSIQNLHQPLDYSPFEIICPTARGWPRYLLLRGEIVIRETRLDNQNPQGKFVRRQKWA